jgi:integrase
LPFPAQNHYDSFNTTFLPQRLIYNSDTYIIENEINIARCRFLDMTPLAFGRFNSKAPLSLRSFEIAFGINAREGPSAWVSSDSGVQNLLSHLGRFTRSYGSREKYLQVLQRFCCWSGHNPSQLTSLGRTQIESLIQGFIDDLAELDRSPSYLNSLIKRLKTFFHCNGIDDLRVTTYFVPTRYRKRAEHIPSKTEIFAMADASGSPKNRAIILLLWTTGLRVSTLCSLNIGDVKDELEEEEPYVKVSVHPALKERLSDACKGGIPYYVFMSPDARLALRTYLRDREEKYGAPGIQNPLLHSEWSLWERHERSSKRLGRRGVEQVVKRAARLAGLHQWKNVTPHAMRKAFESLLTSPTIDGGRLDKATQEFFMGHILPGSQDPYYDKTRVTFHRQEYAKLDFSRGKASKKVRDKIVSITELEKYFNDGWQYVTTLNESKSIVRRSG